MQIISKESNRASQSIDQFLDFATPRDPVYSAINLSDSLREVLTMLHGSGNLNENYRLEGNFKSTKVRYYGNTNQIKQVFWNLLKNALKAMPEGGALSINFIQDKNDKLKIKIAVQFVVLKELA